jgi:phosphoribosylpyrophosphate synthetase
MGDAVAVTEAFVHLFRNVPAARPGVCLVCHSGPNESRAAEGPFAICSSCRRTTEGLHGPVRQVVPISLCVHKGDDAQLYDIVARNKRPASPSAGVDRTTFLAATVSRFYRAHATCLAGAAGGPFTLVTTLPGTALDRPIAAFDPMPRVVGMISALRPLYRPVLLPGGRAAAATLAHRDSDERAFEVLGRLDGRRVLLLDDLFVSGAHVQSAASALHRAGAAAVVALVVARLVVPASNDNSARIWAEASAEPFDFGRCCLRAPAARGAEPDEGRHVTGNP